MNAAEMDIGMKWLFRENGKNFLEDTSVEGQTATNMQFSRDMGGPIGLANVPGGSLPCSHQTYFNRYLASWKSGSTLAEIINSLVILVLHELGLHMKGFSHTNGGIGNPSIRPRLRPTWRGDPAESMQVSGYGGVPWPGEPDPPTPPQPPISDEWPGPVNPVGPSFHLPKNSDGKRKRVQLWEVMGSER